MRVRLAAPPVVLAALAALAISLAIADEEEGGLRWFASIEEGLAAARESGRPVAIVFR